jgi:hypothetical protein
MDGFLGSLLLLLLVYLVGLGVGWLIWNGGNASN